jgi:ribonucleotide monophosphatase NagD (HAD superfamily)
MAYFRSQPDSGVTKPSQVAFIGDRLLTDVMIANSIGAYAVWTKDGVADGGVRVGFVSHSLTSVCINKSSLLVQKPASQLFSPVEATLHQIPKVSLNE